MTQIQVAFSMVCERKELVHRFESASARGFAASARKCGEPNSEKGTSARWSPYTSDVEATRTRLPKRLQYSSTVTVPWMLVTIVWIGCFDDQPHPHRRGEVVDDVALCTSSFTIDRERTESTTRWKSGWPRR